MDLNAVVEEAVELTVLGQRNAGSLRRDYAADLPPAVVDPVQIQQVVVNLLRNAFEAVKGQPNPIVRVRTRRTPATADSDDRGHRAGSSAQHAAEPVQGVFHLQEDGNGPGTVDIPHDRAESCRGPHGRSGRQRPWGLVQLAFAHCYA